MRFGLFAAIVAAGLVFSADRASAQVVYPAPVISVAPYYPTVRTWSTPYVYSTYVSPVFIQTRQWLVTNDVGMATGSGSGLPSNYWASGAMMVSPAVIQVGYTTYVPIAPPVYRSYSTAPRAAFYNPVMFGD